MEAIRSADTFLLVLSTQFPSSEGARFEAEAAQKAEHQIISLMIDPLMDVRVLRSVSTTHSIDFSQPDLREKSLRTLLKLLEADAGLASQAAPAVEEPAEPEVVAKPEPRGTVPGYIFLSYAREDSEFTQSLRRDLEQAGLRIWGGWVLSSMAEDTEEERSRREIELSTVFVALLSRHTLDMSPRRLSRFEREMAARIVSEKGPSSLFVLSVALDDTNLMEAGLPDLFYQMDWFYLREGRDRQRLVEIVKEIALERTQGQERA